MYANRDVLTTRKAKEVLGLYRAGHIKPVPIRTFDCGDVGQAYRYFSARERIGKVVVSLENPKTLVSVRSPVFSILVNVSVSNMHLEGHTSEISGNI